MKAWLKQLREFCWPSLLARDEHYMSKAQADEVERIMPGEVLIITLRGRKFAMVEEEEFELLLGKAGYRMRTTKEHS